MACEYLMTCRVAPTEDRRRHDISLILLPSPARLMPNAPDTSRASLHKGLKQKTRENGTLKTRISRLNQSTQDLKSDNKRLRDERDALRKENQVKDTEMARLTRDLNEKRALIDRMRVSPAFP